MPRTERAAGPPGTPPDRWAVYERHHAAVRAYAARRVEPDVVDDVVAETFAVAGRKRVGRQPLSTPCHVTVDTELSFRAMPSRIGTGALAAACAFVLSTTPAAARDYAETALNIVPSGQYGGAPVPAGADTQAKMYDALTPLFDQVTNADLERTFKSAKLGDAPGPTRNESVPRKGVTIVRDKFNVPHIKGRTRDDVVWAMGWVLQEDRGLLLAQGRNPGRIAALDVPNVSAFGLVTNLTPFKPTKEADRLIEREQIRNLRAEGEDGRAILHEIDVYIDGINARMKAEKSTQPPFGRADIFGFIALAGELFGRGGGDEAYRSTLLSGLTKRLGAGAANNVFDDLTSTNDADRPNTLTKAFPYNKIPKTREGNAILDAGSFKPTSYGASARAAQAAAPATRSTPHASNFLMVAGNRSTNGHPLFVAGPQIGYYYPGLTLEADISWPGHQMRGVYSPAHPGVIFIGRGQDFAYSLTSAGNDTADEFVETLCGGSSTKYRYKGRCRSMGKVNVGLLGGKTNITFRTTVHGPVTGYGTVGGRKVAVARERSSAGRDALWMLPFRDATLGKIKSSEDLFKAANRQPYTFNVAYADDRDIAMFSAGRLPLRNPKVDPRLPTKGTGEYEWRGFLAGSKHPQQKNPATGTLLNWNNRPAPGFGSADNNWEQGPLHRNRLLEAGIAKRDKHDLASVVSAMNAAATQDIRSFGLTPTLVKLLAGTAAPSPRAAQMLEILRAWNATGSSRLDRDENGTIDAGAAPAIWDELYPRLLDAVMGDVLGPQLGQLKEIVGETNNTRSGFTDGGINYLDKDLRSLTGTKFRDPYTTRYCGKGDAAACRAAIWKAFEDTGVALAAKQGGKQDPAAWTADANAERITFAPGLLQTKIRYTNRPSGIQQVVSFTGHRPRG
ncbi:MAG TPA: penicillin acylase family protein [Solirubrobacteraceae bacterium]|nr:penicillin acylase family protein [Solirubrobacteraceae bacterium]